MEMETLETLKGKKKGWCIPCIAGIVGFLGIAMIAIALILNSGGLSSKTELPTDLTEDVVDDIVQHGQILLTERINAGDDLSAGPCLDNAETYENWVIDIAHNPRQPVDDKRENQCSAYRKGDAENFVELSLSGDIINMYPDLRTPQQEEVPAESND